MEEILQKLSNPYSKENYNRLLDIYLNSKDFGNFYEKVTSYYQDRDTEAELTDSKINSKFAKSRLMNIWVVINKFSDFFPTEHRIYINAPLNNIGPIVDNFISKCDSQSLPYELKYLTKKVNRNDTIVIGSNTENYERHIEILRQIGKEHPEIVESCGTPPLLTSALDGWMGLADENVANRYTSYTQSRLKAFCKGINRYIYNHKELAKEIGDSWILSIDNEFEDYEYEDDEKEEMIDISLDDYQLEEKSKIKLREYLSKNPEAMNGIYAEFLRECDRYEIDSENPIFYKGSRKQLLETAKHSKVDMTDELEEEIKQSQATHVTNMYLGNENRSNLSVEAKVKIIENIVEKNIEDRTKQLNIYEDLKFLNTCGAISDELMNDISSTIYSRDTLKTLNYFHENYTEVFPRVSSKDTTLKKSLQQSDLTEENMKEIVEERKKAIIEYFKMPIVTEQKERQIGFEKELLNEYKKDRFFSYELKRALELHINLLNDDINQEPQKQETKRKICSELNENSIDMKKVVETAKPPKSEWDDMWL